MDRKTLEKAWLDSYDLTKGTSEEKVAVLATIPSKTLAEETYSAAMELRDEGINAQPSRKGKDSVNHGIQLIQNYEIIIHPKCVEFHKEISNYCWSKDKDGRCTNKPDHEFSHGMDSMRYGVSKILMPETFSFD